MRRLAGAIGLVLLGGCATLDVCENGLCKRTVDPLVIQRCIVTDIAGAPQQADRPFQEPPIRQMAMKFRGKEVLLLCYEEMRVVE